MHRKRGVSPAPEDKMQTCCFVISRSPVRVREVASPGPLTGAGYDLPQSTRDHTRAAPASAPHHDDLTGLGGMCPCPVSQAVRHYLDEVTPTKAASTQRHDHLYARRVVELLGDVAVGVRRTNSNPTRALRRNRERVASEFLRAGQRRAFVEAVWQCTRRGEITTSAGCACLLMLLAGLRLREALDLRWSEVDLNSGVIRFADRDERGTNKTSEGIARPISDDVVAVLRTMPRWSPYVCPNPRTREPYVDIRKSMARVCEVAGVSPRLRRHALRHSFGTALAEAGMTAEEIAAWLGHQSPATASRYTHLTAPTMRRHATRVSAALRGES